LAKRQDFKLLRIDMQCNQVELLEDNLTEKVAWDKSYIRELVESNKTVRRYYYAVTPFVDWYEAGLKFIEYRRSIVLS
jgi:hypothetical protein